MRDLNSSELTDNGDWRGALGVPMRNTISGCQNYLKQNIDLYTQAAERLGGGNIVDARCVYVPPNYKFSDYTSDTVVHSRTMDDIYHGRVPIDPFQIIPFTRQELERQRAARQEQEEYDRLPACRKVQLGYPEEEQNQNHTGSVEAICDAAMQADGYYHFINCKISKIDGAEVFGQFVLNYLNRGGGCWAPENPRDNKPIYGHTLNIGFFLPDDDN